MTNKNDAYYLVKDWTGISRDEVPHKEPKLLLVYGDEVFGVIEEAKEEGRQITVYALGERLLDWS